MKSSARILGDAPDRSYAAKLELFSRFAAPEFCQIFSDLALPSRGMVLDLGCGTGLTTSLLAEALGPDVGLVGLDLSLPHLQAARQQHDLPLVQADAEQLCFREGVFDCIWSCNTINHTAKSVDVLRSLKRHLRINGRLVLAQSGFLPEMFFAWDSHFDDAVRTACHQYYRERYGLQLDDTKKLRSIVGLLHAADFDDVNVRTYVVERVQPLSQADRDYFQRAVFEGLWGEKIRPFLGSADLGKLDRYCDPNSSDYWLERTDFHHIQTITVCEGRIPA